jgi:CRISPR system Cascade subunit CasE
MLTLLQTRPDLGLLFKWAHATDQAALRDDLGYALHAAARAALGELAPKPFVLVQRPQAPALFVGYSAADPAALDRALPSDWRTGERLRFEVRAAPVVRSRAQPGGGYPEIDAAHHPSFGGPGIDREAAYVAWLTRELARDDAASLQCAELQAFSLQTAARRAGQAGGQRRTQRGLLPDVTLRGQLEIRDPAAFQRLLARGVGRHRAFGFGCLLLSPGG